MKVGNSRDRFKVAITGDFTDAAGAFYFEHEPLEQLRQTLGVTVEVLDTAVGVPISIDVLSAYDAIIAKRSPIAKGALADPRSLRTVHIARNGVGLEHLDLEGCAQAGIIVTNTPEAVRRPIASSAMAFILALAHRLREKDESVRRGSWGDRHLYKGIGLRGRTLGIIGCGGIGSELLRLAAPWGMNHLAVSPSKTAEEVAALGARRVDLATLLVRSDFVVLCCALTAATRHIINAEALVRMKRGSYLVNVGRGGLVDEAALINALRSKHLAGAALDVFDPEPPAPENPLLSMANVLVTAHNVGFSDEGNQLGNTAAAAAVGALAAGYVPQNVTNPSALNHPRVQDLMASRVAAIEEHQAASQLS